MLVAEYYLLKIPPCSCSLSLTGKLRWAQRQKPSRMLAGPLVITKCKSPDTSGLSYRTLVYSSVSWHSWSLQCVKRMARYDLLKNPFDFCHLSRACYLSGTVLSDFNMLTHRPSQWPGETVPIVTLIPQITELAEDSGRTRTQAPWLKNTCFHPLDWMPF